MSKLNPTTRYRKCVKCGYRGGLPWYRTDAEVEALSKNWICTKNCNARKRKKPLSFTKKQIMTSMEQFIAEQNKLDIVNYPGKWNDAKRMASECYNLSLVKKPTQYWRKACSLFIELGGERLKGS